MHESLRWVIVHISMSSCSDIVYVQNSSTEIYMPEEFPGSLRGGEGWGLGMMLARRGDMVSSSESARVTWLLSQQQEWASKWSRTNNDRTCEWWEWSFSKLENYTMIVKSGGISELTCMIVATYLTEILISQFWEKAAPFSEEKLYIPQNIVFSQFWVIFTFFW